ncbi:MAG: enoyl-CoA hydratase-related protein [Candidatus Promineifilaceae bacterium]|nr:enoyl-CoA hydratase-related protein [Candidatus Promineifilaceae bacterium]
MTSGNSERGSQYETILYDLSDGVATITLNRPEKLNAFNDQMIQETTTAVKEAGRDREARCVVITGAGRGFSSGQDLASVEARKGDFSIGEHLRKGYNRLIARMTTLEKPVIGAINGVAAGAGCGVALACDLRIASDRASFIQVFSKVGLIPDSGSTWMLPRLIGYARAYEMAITADKVPAEKALAWGLVNEVVPAEQLDEVVAAWAQRLAQGPTLAFGLTKRAMYRAQRMSLHEALDYEAMLQEVAGGSQDHREGVAAFLEKRQPLYRGE